MQTASGPKHLSAFQNNYLAAIGVAAFLLCSIFADAQAFPPGAQSPFAGRENRRVIDSALFGPTGCGIPTDSTFLNTHPYAGVAHVSGIPKKYAQYYDTCGHHFYLWDPALKAWHISDSMGTAFDSTHLSHRIDQKIDSIVRRNDSVFNCYGATCVFSYLDTSSVGGTDTTIVPTIPRFLDSTSRRLIHVTLTTIRARVPDYNAQQIYLDAGVVGGIFQYDNTDITTADDSAMVFVASDGSRWKRVILGDFINVKWFGAVGNSAADDWYAIQKAINYVAKNSTSPRNVFFPAGGYKINSPIIVANFSGTTYTQVCVNLIGQSNQKDAASGLVQIIPTFNNTFAIGIQLGKGCTIKNLKIIGKFIFPNSLNGIQVDTLTFAQWDDGSSRQNTFSPYAGIVIDPFSDSTAYTSNSDMYPGLHGYCPAGMSRGGSSDITIQYCQITWFVVGIILTPSNQQNAEMINVLDCNIGGNKVSYAITQAQSKECHLDRFMCWGATHTIIDNQTYGFHHGDGSEAPIVDGGNIAFAVHQLGNIRLITFRSSISNVYAEGLYKLGFFSSVSGFTFYNCDFNFASVGLHQPYPDFFILGSNINFKDCQLRLYGNVPNRLIFSGSNTSFEGGAMNCPPVITNLQSGSNFPNPTFKNVSMFYSTGMLGTGNISNGTANTFSSALGLSSSTAGDPVYAGNVYEWSNISGVDLRYKITYNSTFDRRVNIGSQRIRVTRSQWNGYIVVTPAADTNLLKAGDMLVTTSMNYDDQFSGTSAGTYPVGFITKIGHDTLYLDNIAQGMTDSTLHTMSAMYYVYTKPPLTGNLASGSNKITAVQSTASTVASVGDRIDIPQFAVGTKVIAISNDTITFSTNNQTSQTFNDYTWVNGYPKIEMYSSATIPELRATGNRTLFGNAYLYKLNFPNLGDGLSYPLAAMLNSYTDVYYNANTNLNGDTSKHKLKYYAINTQVPGMSVPTGTTAQALNTNYLSNGTFLQINKDSASNGFPHLITGDPTGLHQVAYKQDLAALTDATKKDKLDSITPGGYTTIATKNKLADSLMGVINALLALKRDIADTTGPNGTARLGRVHAIVDSLLATLSGAAPFTDASALVKNSSDATKLAQFSAVNITTATTRLFSFPDFDGMFAMSNHAQSWIDAQDFTGATLTVATPTGGTEAANKDYVDGAVTGSAGTYTPTLTNTANIASSSVLYAMYTVSSSGVHVTIKGAITPTAGASSCQLTFTLPFSIAGGGSCQGSGTYSNVGLFPGLVVDGDGTTTAVFEFIPTTNSSGTYTFYADYLK